MLFYALSEKMNLPGVHPARIFFKMPEILLWHSCITVNGHTWLPGLRMGLQCLETSSAGVASATLILSTTWRNTSPLKFSSRGLGHPMTCRPSHIKCKIRDQASHLTRALSPIWPKLGMTTCQVATCPTHTYRIEPIPH